MPLPRPTSDEAKDSFIERCMSDETMQEEYPDREQRAAVCNSQWRRRNASARQSPLLEAALKNVWAMDEGYCHRVIEVLARHAEGVALYPSEVQAATRGGGDKREYEVRDGVAYLPITGVLAKRSSQINGVSSPVGTSVAAIRSGLRAALRDEDVRRIVLDIDSPGGSVDGIADLAAEIEAARGKKEIVAFADGMMASAAYWLGSAAGKIVASRDAVVGSMGVYAILEDYSQALAHRGVRKEMIRAGRYKGLDNPAFPITPESRANTQSVVDSFYNVMVASVAQARGWPIERALELADGRVHIGEAALRQGLVDAIGTIDMAAGTPADEIGVTPAQATSSGLAGVVNPLAHGVVGFALTSGDSANHFDLGLQDGPAEASTETGRGNPPEGRRGPTVGPSHHYIRIVKGESHMPDDGKEKTTVLLTRERLEAVHPDLVKEIQEQAIANDRHRARTVAQLIAESELPDGIKARLMETHGASSPASVRELIAKHAQIEASLKAGEMMLVAGRMPPDEIEEHMDCLRLDIDGMGVVNATAHVRRTVDKLVAARERVIVQADRVAQGKDPEPKQEPEHSPEEQRLLAGIASAKANYAKIRKPFVSQRDYVLAELRDEDPEKLAQLDPELA